MILDYSKLFMGLGMPCVIVSPDSPTFTIIDANSAYVSLFDFERENLIGNGFFSVFPDSEFIDEPNWRSIFDKTIREIIPDSQGVRTWVNTSLKQITISDVKYFDINHFPVFDEKGKIVAIVRTLADLSSYVVPKALHTEAQASVGFGNWWIDIENQTIRWSEGMRTLFEVEEGFQPDFGNVKEFYKSKSDEEAFLQKISSAIERKGALKTFISVNTAKGNNRRLKVIGKTYHLGDKFKGIHGTALDVTDWFNERMALDDIYFRHNHDLRAPLARIIGVAEYIKRSANDENPFISMVDILLESAEEMDTVIKGIINRNGAKSRKDA